MNKYFSLGRNFLITFISFSLLACVPPRVPVEDLANVSSEIVAESSRVAIYLVGDNVSFQQMLGPVEAYSCKHLTSDPPASKGDALKRLRLNAYRLGANAIVDVTFDSKGTDAFGTNCWESVFASGNAVLIQR